MTRLLIVLAAAALWTAQAQAADYTVGALKISNPWARATPKGAPVGGGYLSITNTGNTPDRLISGSSDAAGRFEVHEMSMDGGVMKMRPINGGLQIKPGQTVELKPGGLHVMFMGLNKQLQSGQNIKATLVFEKAGKVDIEFPIVAMGAAAPGGGMQMQPGGMQHNH